MFRTVWFPQPLQLCYPGVKTAVDKMKVDSCGWASKPFVDTELEFHIISKSQDTCHPPPHPNYFLKPFKNMSLTVAGLLACAGLHCQDSTLTQSLHSGP